MKRETKQALIINFYRCGPCRFIAPVFEKLAEENPEVEFVKVDVDEAQDVSEANGIACMPKFHFIKDGKKVDQLEGGSEEKLVELIAKHKAS
jgi:thioredoxin 1